MQSTPLQYGIHRETGRSFDERFKEHLRAPSPIFNHFKTTGHNITLDNFSEAIFMRVMTHLKQESGQISTTPHLRQSAAGHASSLLTVTPTPNPVPLPHWHYP